MGDANRPPEASLQHRTLIGMAMKIRTLLPGPEDGAAPDKAAQPADLLRAAFRTLSMQFAEEPRLAVAAEPCFGGASPRRPLAAARRARRRDSLTLELRRL
jgi:hypothetical protein